MVANIKVDMRNVQEQVGDSAKATRQTTSQIGRKTTLATLGLVGIAYDTSKSIWAHSVEFASHAEKRGEEMENNIRGQVKQFKNKRKEEVRELRTGVTKRVNSISDELTTRGKNVETEMKSALSRLKQVGRGQLEPHIESVTIDVDIETREPFTGYDEMNVQEIVERLDTMEPDALTEIRAYELANKNRITILREIDERM